ncbi:MAG: 3-phosphoshikimate 1-carboxyvinyltransferase [Leptonema illini]|jgi:3-phosphoshikimate 1-carboxyvinyltransferase|uniref:3-phosphoshikimate 1-carboxyvinyltransferase n=1 Tax=Leptonema illini TaxID=183 RepID=A0A833GXM7_9LEPT|nr:MAG: 3-phosphoshikimate 1-carboxyvinyltransferase [Leptonema illini]
MSLFKRTSAAGIERLEIPRIGTFFGEVRLPGSKSIGNRALLLAALARGETILQNVPDSDDVSVMLKQMPSLGVGCFRLMNEIEGSYRVVGAGGPFSIKEGLFDVENAGTALRPLVAVLSAGQGSYTIDGNEQMRRRPVADLVAAVRTAGVAIECSAEGTPPVTMRTDGWKSADFTISGKTSSQFISALLLAAPLSRRRVTITLPDEPVSRPYIDMTLRMMEQFGVRTEREGYTQFIVPEKQCYESPGTYYIEGDATAATYFMTAGMLSGPVRIHGLDESSIQGDIRYLDIIRAQGGRVKTGKNWIETQHQGPVRGITVDMNDMPDAAMTLAITGLFADKPVEIRNVENLRVKESERIRGLRTELEKFGAAVDEFQDGLRVHPPQIVHGAEVETYRDHRMAMAFSLAAIRTDLVILDPACVNKTYPRYFEDFERICHPSTI